MNVVIWSLGIGICLCSLYISYNKVVLGRFVRELLNRNALSPETSLTLKDVGFEKNFFVSRALLHTSSSLRGVVEKHEEGYYIPENKIPKAQAMFSAKGASPLVAVGAVVLIIAVTYLVTLVLPFIVPAIQSAF